MTQQYVGNARLLKLAAHLETVKPASLKMAHWVSNENVGYFYPSELDPKIFQGDTRTVKVSKVVNECGFAACAVGHACGIKSFKK